MHASVNVGCQGKSGSGKIQEVILVLIRAAAGVLGVVLLSRSWFPLKKVFCKL